MRWIFLAFTLLCCTPAYAQDVESIPPGDDVIEPVKKGEPAPFSGQLFDTSTALRWGNWLQQYKLRLDVDVKAVEKVCKAELDYNTKLREIDAERNKRVEDDLRVRLVASEKRNAVLYDKLNNPSFFRSAEFGVLLGVVSSTVVVVVVGVMAK